MLRICLISGLLLLLAFFQEPSACAQTVGSSWSQTGGPNGGNLYHLSPGNGDTLWAATASGVYYSTSKPPTWNRIWHSPFTAKPVRRVLQRPNNQLLVLTHDSLYIGNAGRGWQSSLPASRLRDAVCSPQSCWVLTDSDSLWRSDATGKNWQNIAKPEAVQQIASLFAQSGGQNDGKLWLASTSGLQAFYTTNGSDWINASEELPTSEATLTAWAETSDSIMAGTSDGRLFARALSGSNKSWQLRGGQENLGAFIALAVHPQDLKHLLAGTDRRAIRSLDGGANWQTVFSPAREDSVYTVRILSDGRSLVGAYRSGCVELLPNQVREVRNAGLLATAPAQVLWIDSTQLICRIDDGSLFRSEDSGASWQAASAGLGGEIHTDLATANGDTLYLSVLGINKVYRSTDAGISWTSIGRDLPGFGIQTLHWHATPRLLYASTFSSGVYYWENEEWEALPTLGLPGTNFSINVLQTDSKGILHCVLSGQGVYAYDAASERWAPRNLGLSASSSLVQQLYVGAKDDSLYAAAAEKLLVWRGASRWVMLHAFTQEPDEIVLITGMAQDSLGTLYLSTSDRGIWSGSRDSVSENYSWFSFSEGLFNSQVNDFRLGSGNWFVAATEGDGVFVRPFWVSTDTVIDTTSRRRLFVSPAGLRLYPNPATDFVRLEYESESNHRLTATLYDGMGRELHVWPPQVVGTGLIRLSLPLPDGLSIGWCRLQAVDERGRSFGGNLWVVD